MTQAHLKLTPLHANHRARGAKMVPFAGWDMPLQFTRVLEEHLAVRQAAGLFDVSHMGLVAVQAQRPGDAIQFLDTLVPRDLKRRLTPGKAVYTQLLNPSGGILDDIIVYRMPETAPHFSDFGECLLVVNAANTAADLAWMESHPAAESGVSFQLRMDQYCLYALQGPKFANVLVRLGVEAGQLPKRFAIAEATLAGVPVLLSRTGYTGEDGVEIVVPAAHALRLWDQILEAGADLGVKPVGLAARDTLRVEASLPLHGADITERTTPLEAGLGWSVDLDKPTPFVGQEVLHQQRAVGLPRHFVCFRLLKNTIPRSHDKILMDGRVVGEVTSGAIAPMLNAPVGMGYVEGLSAAPPVGTSLVIQGHREALAEVVARPFYKPGSLSTPS